MQYCISSASLFFEYSKSSSRVHTFCYRITLFNLFKLGLPSLIFRLAELAALYSLCKSLTLAFWSRSSLSKAKIWVELYSN